MENGFGSVDLDALNLAGFIVNELRAASPIKTGNMQRSIAAVEIGSTYIDIVVAVDYASYVNESKKHKHWIDKVLDRVTRCYSENNVEDLGNVTGLPYSIVYGDKGE